jgi:hypothetical protein
VRGKLNHRGHREHGEEAEKDMSLKSFVLNSVSFFVPPWFAALEGSMRVRNG